MPGTRREAFYAWKKTMAALPGKARFRCGYANVRFDVWGL
jgi:hypothetical protein